MSQQAISLYSSLRSYISRHLPEIVILILVYIGLTYVNLFLLKTLGIDRSEERIFWVVFILALPLLRLSGKIPIGLGIVSLITLPYFVLTDMTLQAQQVGRLTITFLLIGLVWESLRLLALTQKEQTEVSHRDHSESLSSSE
ncbi:MAG: hypothetical protein BRC23_02700 [Parcubacteria group bacterium SW_4_49_11]|nr:MAG: hypothetical protein BRC23_02700 [Parcubacteria group bacterium SW_4_49_11]